MKKPEIKTFRGDFFQIGKQEGEIYKKNGMDLNSFKFDSKIYKKQLEIYKKYYPEMLEELRGITLKLNLNEEKVINYFITNEIEFLEKKYF